MALSKQIVTDKIEIVKIQNHYSLQVREAVQIIESGNVISQNFHRYVLNQDADVSTISDPVVKAQFEAVMTSEVKDNYAKFLKDNEPK